MKTALILIVLVAVACVTVAKKSKQDSICRLPKKVGLCKAAFPRYYYDSQTNACEFFIYGGCGKNGNNFETLAECEATCLTV
ncbi:hypothetical protein BaRGS_00034764 [Batillaria attramentaria]|uniref:BPTI/Kunitz inhibitor domain-containing protein n=1 Tax=Batillaria attramentaria TaxID=370345 RepID=A0ABD0JGM9_9CAEN